MMPVINILLRQEFQMPATLEEDTLEKLNKFFSKQIFNQVVLQRYFFLYERALSSDLSIFLEATTRQKTLLLPSFAQKMSAATEQPLEKCLETLKSRKKTDITQFWTTILIPREKDRKMIQTMRTKLVLKLRKDEQVNSSEIEAFIHLYEIISQTVFKQDFTKQSSDKSIQLKSMLISLKKVMGVGKEQRQMPSKAKKAKQKAYLINVDVRTVLTDSCYNIQNLSLRNKLENMIKDSKNRNWFGPNLYKALEASDFSNGEMNTVLQVLKSVSFDQIQLKTTFQTAQKIMQKVTQNLETFLKNRTKSKAPPKNETREEANLEHEGFDLPSMMLFDQPPILKEQEEQIKEIQESKEQCTLFNMLCLSHE